MLSAQKNLTRGFYMLLSLPATAMGFALSVQISALSWILSTKYNLDIHEVGLVWAAGPLAGILGQVIIGLISDKVWFWNGRRRPFIFIGGFLACMMLLGLPNIDLISTTLGIEGIFGIAMTIALVLDLSINVSFNPTRSIIADVTPEGQPRTRGYTWMQTISGSFGVLAYGIGAYFGNISLIYFGAGLVLLFSLVPPLFIKEPREFDVPEGGSQARLSFMQMVMAIRPLWGFLFYNAYALTLRIMGLTVDHYYVEIFFGLMTAYLLLDTILRKNDPAKSVAENNMLGFRQVLAAHSFSWIGVQTVFVYMFAYLSGTFDGVADDRLGQILSICFLIFNAVGALFPAFILEPLSAKIGRVSTHILSLATMTVGYGLILAFGGQDVTFLYTCMALCGIGWSAIISLPFAIVSQKIDSSQMGLYMGLFNLSVVLPQLVVSLSIGLLVSSMADKSVVFMIAAGSLLVSTILWQMAAKNLRGNAG